PKVAIIDHDVFHAISKVFNRLNGVIVCSRCIRAVTMPPSGVCAESFVRVSFGNARAIEIKESYRSVKITIWRFFALPFLVKCPAVWNRVTNFNQLLCAYAGHFQEVNNRFVNVVVNFTFNRRFLSDNMSSSAEWFNIALMRRKML